MRMEWCLECHRAPEKFLRPKDQVFNMNYEQPSELHPVKLADGTAYTDQTGAGFGAEDAVQRSHGAGHYELQHLSPVEVSGGSASRTEIRSAGQE